LIHTLLFQPTLSVAFTLFAFGLIIWPGYAVLHLFGFGRHRWEAATFAGPAVTLAIWIIILSGTVWASIPLQRVSGLVWISTFVLALLGIVLRISARRQFPAGIHQDRRRPFCWLIAFFLAFAAMPSTIHYGLGIFASSVTQDSWNYIAAADYFSHVTRGTEGGLSPLDQYGSMFMNARNASSALLAFLSTGLGVSAAEVISLYCLLVLFANSCALIAFACTIFRTSRPIIAFSLFAGFGVPMLIVTYANFDQMLILPFLPLVAALAVKAGRGESMIGAGVILGILFAASIFAYVELAVLALPVAMTFICAPERRLPFIMLRAAGSLCVAIPLTLILTWPGMGSLAAFFESQYSISTQPGVRPGDGVLANWLLRGDFFHLWWSPAIVAASCAIAAMIASGAWFERKRWAAVIALFGVSVLIGYFLIFEKYLYAVYKIASVNCWMISFFAVSGAESVLRLVSRKSSDSFRLASSATLISALLMISLTSAAIEIRLRENAVRQEGYREAVTLAAIIGATLTILSVRDVAANQWAVFHFAAVPVIISPYRSTMGQPEVLPIMNRARVIDRTSVMFIVTDHDETIRSTVTGGHLAWDGRTYSLWKLDGGNWSVTARGGVYNDNVDLSGLADAAGSR
jgi:hypothetical protein